MTQEIYLLAHDYGGLEGRAYDSYVPDVSFTIETSPELMLEVKTLSDGQKNHYDLLGDESDKHFAHLVKRLFPDCAITSNITRDIYEFYLEWSIVPKDKSPIPENELGVLQWDFPYYPIFGSTLISIENYLKSENREYYESFYKFDRIIAELDRRIKIHKGFENAVANMKCEGKAFKQFTKSLSAKENE